jgi:single-stranded-DNA-specific exonuclease
MAEAAVRQAENRVHRTERKIVLREQLEDVARQIESAKGVDAVTARVLAARGFVPGEDLDNYLEPTLKNGLPAPDLLKNLQEACELTVAIVAEKKPVAICCDFDVDGMSGGSLLSRFLLDAGVPNKVFVPDRFKDGYGLNVSMVEEIAAGDFGLLITVDYGTTNEKEINLAKEHSIPTIVIDHHHVEAVPPADVFVNPKQEGCNFADATLCAAGLVWYFVVALRKVLPGAKGLDPRDYLDLACLGTICDMVPLVGVNRVIALKGLERLTTTKRAGLRALKDVVGIKKEVTCGTVGFGIGPRLNAAGRMVNGELVIQLLTTTDSKKAGRIARRLNKLNAERQDIERAIKDDAIERVAKSGEVPSGIVVWDKDFHTGVIGIVAQRLVETFYRPSIVCGEDDGLFKGSARGIKGFSVVEALGELKEYLVKFGGHDGAAGFSAAPDKISAFAEAFDALCKKKLAKLETQPTVLGDTELKLKELTPAAVHELAACAPFGIGNPAPVIVIHDLEIADIRVLKNEHLKLVVKQGTLGVTAVFWKVAEHEAIVEGGRVTLAAKPEINVYNGQKSLQLNIQAISEV